MRRVLTLISLDDEFRIVLGRCDFVSFDLGGLGDFFDDFAMSFAVMAFPAHGVAAFRCFGHVNVFSDNLLFRRLAAPTVPAVNTKLNSVVRAGYLSWLFTCFYFRRSRYQSCIPPLRILIERGPRYP